MMFKKKQTRILWDVCHFETKTSCDWHCALLLSDNLKVDKIAKK